MTFFAKYEKNIDTAITFAYDVEKMRLIYQKKLEKKRKPTPNSKGKKSYFKMKFFSYKIKKNKKIKNFNFFGFAEFLGFLKFSDFFGIF